MSHELLLALFTAGLAVIGWAILALNKNTIALVKLEMRMEELTKRIEIIPKLEKDVNALGAKLREKGKSL